MRRVPCRRLAVPALAIAALAAGCGSTRGDDGLPSDPAARETVLGETLELLDPQLGESHLDVTLRNPGDARMATRCAPEWLDAKGVVVAPANDWQRVDLEPGATVRLRFASKPAKSSSWRMRFAP